MLENDLATIVVSDDGCVVALRPVGSLSCSRNHGFRSWKLLGVLPWCIEHGRLFHLGISPWGYSFETGSHPDHHFRGQLSFHPKRKSSLSPVFETNFEPNMRIFSAESYNNQIRPVRWFFLYGWHPRSSLRILWILAREMASSLDNHRTNTVFFRFIQCLTFLIVPGVRMIRRWPE